MASETNTDKNEDNTDKNENNDDEIDLRERMINSTFKYYQSIRISWYKKFINETKHLILDDTNWFYKYITIPSNHTHSDDIRKLFHKLSILFHPDKCNEIWASNIFHLIKSYYENNDIESLLKVQKFHEEYMIGKIWNLDFIANINDKSESNESMESNINNQYEDLNLDEKELQIEKWKCEVWYQYLIGNKNIKEMFVSPEVYEKNKVAKIEKEINNNNEYVIEIQLDKSVEEIKYSIKDLICNKDK